MPARDIATELGFSSAAYFTRAFSKLAGYTPSEFRKLPPMRQILHAG
jgi:AraC-like DNA-binding protein